jgi:hypothetical protein
MREIATEVGLQGRITTAERSALSHVAALMLRVEVLKEVIIDGGLVDGDELVRASSEVRRLIASLRRGARLVPPQPTAPGPLRQRLAARVTP